MTVGTVGVENNTPQISKKEKREQAIQRVKTEFLSQIGEGVSEKEAFKNSLKAIDKKYNPNADKFCCESAKVGASPKVLNQSVKTVKNLNPESVKVWLEIIEKALPVILTCVTAIENFVDWLIEKMAPKEETAEVQN